MKTRCLSRRGFLQVTGGTLLSSVVTRSLWANPASVPPQVPYASTLKVKTAEAIRILQVTDLHFFGRDKVLKQERNALTLEILRDLVAQTKPDLIVATGDLWPENKENKGEERMRWAIAQFESFGIPWAYTWGNHDQLADYSVGHKAFAEAKNCLFRGVETDGNYVINVEDPNGTWCWQILCLNSQQDGLGKSQQQWLKRLAADSAGATPPRIAFFHIPIKQYLDIWANGTANGFLAEIPCFEKEDGSTLAFFKELGVKACFCGHDHVNDYSGVIDGVELVYGRATGFGAYGANLLGKGGKLITLTPSTKSVDWVTILPEGKQWKPAKGERIDKSAEK